MLQSWRDVKSPNLNWKFATLMAGLIALWCNMHTGYVIALGILLLHTGASLLADRSARALSGRSKTYLATLCLGAFAGLANPYGLTMWLYLPHLLHTRHFPGLLPRCKECH